MKKRWVKGLVITLGIFTLFLLSIMAFMNIAPQFGASPSGDHLESISHSPNYGDGIFKNQIETKMDYSPSNVWGMLKESIGAKNTAPDQLIETGFQRKYQLPIDSILQVTWYGHSSLLLEIEGKKIFLDPMLGPNASPVSFFGSRFGNTPSFDLALIPDLDIVIFSHDHYDHLDYPTIQAIKDRVGQFYTPLGLGAHLVAWGVDKEKITELDWWEEAKSDLFTFTATPARHFSGRKIGSNNTTLWASWVIHWGDHQIYFSGDSGYGPHFKEIGERFGSFDFAMMECGQYNERWEPIHMMPEQTVQATVDLNASKMMPIHWAGFTLSPHAWYEPAERVLAASAKNNIDLVTPTIGVPFTLLDTPKSRWWKTAISE